MPFLRITRTNYFLRAALATKVISEQWRPMARQKRLYLHHQGEFQHENCMLGSLHDSDYDDVVRIFVGLSCELRLFTLDYITRHNCSPTKSVINAAQFFPYQECN